MISQLSSVLLNFQMLQQEKNEKMLQLQDFLRQHNVDITLSFAVEQQVRARIHSVKPIAIVDVSGLVLASTLLRNELNHVIYAPFICIHPIFRTAEVLDPRLVWE